MAGGSSRFIFRTAVATMVFACGALSRGEMHQSSKKERTWAPRSSTCRMCPRIRSATGATGAAKQDAEKRAAQINVPRCVDVCIFMIQSVSLLNISSVPATLDNPCSQLSPLFVLHCEKAVCKTKSDRSASCSQLDRGLELF